MTRFLATVALALICGFGSAHGARVGAPLMPTISEPSFDGRIVNPADVHMEAWTYEDPDNDLHLNSDVEIWKLSPLEKVWDSPAIGGIEKNHLHLGDGAFVGSYSARRDLEYGTEYRLRFRFRDASGELSPWAERLFSTSPPGPPGIPGPMPWLPAAGFTVDVVAEGFEMPVNIAFVPNPGPNPTDPLFYVTELYGTVRVVLRNGSVGRYAGAPALNPPPGLPDSLLNFDPTGVFPGSGEQGLSGIVVDPRTGDVFVSMVYSEPPPVGPHYPKVVRLSSSDGGRTSSSMTTVLSMPGEDQGQSHFISNLTIGPDGKLYVHNGDGFDHTTAQNMNSFRGKILRLNLDGTAPSDNPFYDAADGITARDYIWALGLRNPFGGAWRAADNAHYEVENGPSVDRFAKVVAGRNFGWDNSDASMATFAIHNWDPAHGPVNVAFVQASTFQGSGFPLSKMDRAFVTESGPTYAGGPQALGKRIVEFELDAAGNKVSGPTRLVEYIGAGRATAVGLAAGPDGLYFSELYKDTGATNPIQAGARIMRVRWVGTGVGDGTGLQGEYFNNQNLTAPVATRFDPTIDFPWGNFAPLPGMDPETFSVRWTGFVKPGTSETYTFTTANDDGVRLWVNDQLLVDDWISHSLLERSGSIALQAGQTYALRMEYFDAGAGAVAQLFWSTPTLPRQIVPQDRLYPPAGAATPVAAPSFTPGAGTFSAPMSVTIATSTPGAAIRYTTDGSTPTPGSGIVYSGPVPISASTVFRAIASQAGHANSPVSIATFTRVLAPVAAPTFSPPPGSYAAPQSVTLSTPTIGASIRYTTDGSTPTATTGLLYAGPVLIPSTLTLRAIAVLAGSGDSSVSSGSYLIVPTASGTGLRGEYFNNADLTAPVLTRTDATVNFVWGGGSPAPAIDPDSFSVRWTGTIRPQVSDTYTFTTSSDDGVRLYIDGVLLINNWTNHGPTDDFGTLPLVAGQNYDVRLEYYDSGFDSLIQFSWYTSTLPKQIVPQFVMYPSGSPTPPTVATPLFSPPAGVYAAAQAVTISTSTAGSSIRYTTDGSTPTPSTGTLYSGAVPVAATTTIRAIAYQTGFTDSAVVSAVYTLSAAGTGTGLQGEYFNNADLTAPVLTRIDPTLNFVWGNGSPDPAIDPDSFSVRWTGTLKPATTELYTLYTNSDDGVRVYLDGVLILNNWTNHGPTEDVASVPLEAGRSYGLRVEYFDSGFGAVAQLSWSSPSVSKQIVPQSVLYPPIAGPLPVATPSFNPPAGSYSAAQSVAISTSTPGSAIRYTTDGSLPSASTGTLYSGPVSIPASATLRAIAYQAGMPDSAVASAGYTILPPGTGSGLLGEYFNNQDLTALVLTRTDPTINFQWGNGAPAPGVDVDTFSVRWTGSIKAPTTGTYTFYTNSDDGVRLWVNGVPIVNNWTNHGTTEDVGQIALQAGQLVDLRMEFYDSGFGAVAQLSWSSAGIAKQIVPMSVLFPPGGGGPPAAATPTFSPAAGPFSSPISVTISSATAGATIRYTIDGSTPSSTTGIVYSGAVPLSTTTTLRAIAVATGFSDSAVGSAIYTYVPPGAVATPTFSPAPGNFTTPLSVTIQSATAGATIRFTMDGSIPTSSVGTVYSGPLPIAATTTLRAIAFRAGFTDSALATATYTYVPPPAAAPSFTPPAGSYSGPQTVTIATLTPGASIRYTTDGSTPSESTGTLYAAPLNVAATLTLRAVAFGPGYSVSPLSTAAYTISPPGSGVGVRGEYFNNMDFSAPMLTRTDATINFQWSQAPDPSMDPESFSVRWTGFVKAPTTGTYTFYTNSDDGVRLWINGVLLVNNWTNHGPTEDAGQIALQAEQPAELRMEFYDSAFGALAQLSWSAPTLAKQIVPQNRLFPPGTPVPPTQPSFTPPPGTYTGSTTVALSTSTPGASIRYTTDGSTPSSTLGTLYAGPFALNATSTVRAVAFLSGLPDSTVATGLFTIVAPGSGTGLTGEYFNNLNLTGLVGTRTDPTVNFQWGQSPYPGVDPESFSVRWTGYVRPLATETYTFYTNSDDGVRLWVNGVALINNWTNHGPTEDVGQIALQAGQSVELRMEFYDSAFGALAQLSWSSPSVAKQIIPQDRLYPTAASLPVLLAAAADSDPSSGIQAVLDSAQAGERVTLGDGTTLVPSGLVLKAGVSLRGAGPGRTILDGRGAAAVLTLLGSTADGPVVLEGLTLVGGAIGLDAGGADVTLRNVIVAGNTGDGVLGRQGGSVTAIHVTSADNGGHGFNLFGSGSLRNSIAASNGGFGLSASAAVPTVASSLDAPLAFRDPAGLDYRTVPGSPTIDAAESSDPFDREPAPNGGRANQGAYGNTADAESSQGASTLNATVGPTAGAGGGGGCGLIGLEGFLLLAMLGARRRSTRG